MSLIASDSLPFDPSDSRMILYPDPSNQSEFSIHSPMLVAKDRVTFLNTVSPHWDSYGSFSEEEISRMQTSVCEDDITRFVNILLRNGCSVKLLSRTIFKVFVKTNSSYGLLFFDCSHLPNVPNDPTSQFLKICFCSAAALKSAEFNLCYFLSTLGAKVCFSYTSKKRPLSSTEESIDMKRFSSLKSKLATSIDSAKECLAVVAPVVVHLSQHNDNKALKMKEEYLLLLEMLSSQEVMKAACTADYSSQEADTNFDTFLELASASSRLLAALYLNHDGETSRLGQKLLYSKTNSSFYSEVFQDE